MEEKYDASSIKVLKGLEAVRKRPSMYIGDVGKKGFHHILYEVLDNGIDEITAGYAKKIHVKLLENNFIEVSDDGRGIPTEIHPEMGKSALEVVVTTLHAGGKFDKKTYKISGGLHGVGISAVCALSEKMHITVSRNGKVYQQEYSRGKTVTEVSIIGDTDQTGTTVLFKPDPEIFGAQDFDPEYILTRIKELSFLNKGSHFIFENTLTKETQEFQSEKGLVEFVHELSSGKKQIHEPIHIESESSNIRLEIAFTYTDTYHETLYSYVNNIRTAEGGTQITGFKGALTRAINDFIKKHKLLSDTKKISGEDATEGLVGVLSILHPDPQFEGQTKTKLVNSDTRGVVDSAVYSFLREWFDINQSFAKEIAKKIILNMTAREAAKRVRENIRRKTVFESSLLPGKLADCSSKNIEESELYIVEGDSAGGSAKQARDRVFQAILPLRGKILNIEKAGIDKLLKNEQIRNVITALGTGITETFEKQKLRYGKIIIMTDADVDGSHIKTLLLTLLFRYFRPLIEEGHVYSAKPPLYKITKGKELHYAYSDQELNEIVNKLGSKVNISRYKGLGEMNPEQLWDTTMDPKVRTLIQINIQDAVKADELFSILMGEEVPIRREYIEKHALEIKNLDV